MSDTPRSLAPPPL